METEQSGKRHEGGNLMKRAILVGALIVTLVAVASLTGFAMRRDLAVTYLTTWRGTSTTSRVFYQGNDKVRFESEGGGTIVKTGSAEVVANTKQPGVQIMRYDLGVYWTLDFGSHTSLEAPLPPLPSSPANPQPSFTRLPKVGEETILGYVCDIYRTETGNPETYWYTPKLGILLRLETGSGATKSIMEAVDLKVERQPDALFEIPTGFQKAVLQELLQRKVTPADIDNALFVFSRRVTISFPALGKEALCLSTEEISELRASIRSCTGLTEAPGAVDRLSADVIIDVDGRHLSFDEESGTMIVNRSDINAGQFRASLWHPALMQKFSQGIYQFTASPGFTTFIKKMRERAFTDNPSTNT